MRVFDGHFHIIDAMFRLCPNQGYLPPLYTCDDHISFHRSMLHEHDLDFVGGAVVAGSFQGEGGDCSYMTAALDRLGGQYVGVVQLDPTSPITDAELWHLHVKGVRAVRFNFHRAMTPHPSSASEGGANTPSPPLATIQAFLRRINDLLGWHAEFYLRSSSLHSASSDLFRMLAAAPRVVVDHLGMDVDDGADGKGASFALLLELLRTGNSVYVKASGFGRTSTSCPVILASRVQALYSVKPTGVIFGSDVPGTRARVPFQPGDVALIEQALGGEGARRVLNLNGRDLYHLDDHQECFQHINWSDCDHGTDVSSPLLHALEIQEPYSHLLLRGLKTIETREYPLPMALLGVPVLLLATSENIPCQSSLGDHVEASISRGTHPHSLSAKLLPAEGKEGEEGHGGATGESQVKAQVSGAVIFSRSFEFTSEVMWRLGADDHLVPADSAYDWARQPFRRKFGWVVSEVLTLEQTADYISSKVDTCVRCAGGNDASVVMCSDTSKSASSDSNYSGDSGSSGSSDCHFVCHCDRVFKSLFKVKCTINHNEQ